ncbi:hypothetical protein H4Q26_018344 [Puccinia striiformis f. sp. tritici PST-130]|nr:hypothetical protein H4Q26_018344 [Puccinia striiformis f. sp. tritici PST-130]
MMVPNGGPIPQESKRSNLSHLQDSSEIRSTPIFELSSRLLPAETTIRDLTKSDNRILEDRSSADPRRARWTPRYYSSPALASVTPKQAGSTGDQPSQDKKTGWKSMMAMLSLGTLSMGYLLGTSYPPSLMSQVIINSFLQPPKLNLSASYHPIKCHIVLRFYTRGPGKFAIPPIIFINKDKTDNDFDEGLASLAFSNLPNMIGVTASLKLNYKKPVLANQFIILRTWLPADKSPKGRKVWADGRIENVQVMFVEAESLFIEPKGANFLLNSQIKEYIKP